jgi:regulator of replication initiation timing
MIPDIASILDAGKNGINLLKSLASLPGCKELKSKINELENIIFDLRNTIVSLQTENVRLHSETVKIRDEYAKAQADDEAWAETAKKYQLSEQGGPGSLVYMKKESTGVTEPNHALCANCFAKKKKSVLQFSGHRPEGAVYKCFECSSEIIDHSEKPPMTILTAKRRDPFPGY